MAFEVTYFDPRVAPAFEGKVTHLEVIDPVGQLPTNVIDLANPWSVRVQWEIGGLVVPFMAGTWQVYVHLESMGTGFEGEVGPNPHTVNLVTGGTPAPPNKITYDETIVIPAGDVPDVLANQGPYKLVVTILGINGAGTPTGFAAFSEGPIVQFYT